MNKTLHMSAAEYRDLMHPGKMLIRMSDIEIIAVLTEDMHSKI